MSAIKAYFEDASSVWYWSELERAWPIESGTANLTELRDVDIVILNKDEVESGKFAAGLARGDFKPMPVENDEEKPESVELWVRIKED